MRLQEFRDGDTYVIRVELPGIDSDTDVEISVDGEMVHIRAAKEQKSEDTGEDGYWSEFRYGSFARDLRVPMGTKPENVTVTYKDGVLEIRVPVEAKDTTPSMKIPVTRG